MRKKKKSRQCWDFKVTRGTLLRFGLTEYLIASRAAVKVLAFFEKLPPCLVGIEACASSHHLVARAPSAWPYRAPDAASLREALCRTACCDDAQAVGRPQC